MVGALRKRSQGNSGICRRKIVMEAKMDEERSGEDFTVRKNWFGLGVER